MNLGGSGLLLPSSGSTQCQILTDHRWAVGTEIQGSKREEGWKEGGRVKVTCNGPGVGHLIEVKVCSSFLGFPAHDPPYVSCYEVVIGGVALLEPGEIVLCDVLSSTWHSVTFRRQNAQAHAPQTQRLIQFA